MPRYSIQMPIAGYAIKEVEADDEKSAIEAALSEGFTTEEIEEWDAHKAIVTGNVFHGNLKRVSVQQIDD